MSAPPLTTADSEKRDVIQDVHIERYQAALEDEGITKPHDGTEMVVAAAAKRSAFEHLTTREAIWKFRRMFLTGVAASIASTYYGYTSSAPGSIVANTGFIEQFGDTVTSAGKKAISAHVVSIWGLATPIMQITMQFIAPFLIDRFGRLSGLYALTFFMLIAILLEIFSKTWQVYFVAKLFAGMGTGFHAPILTVYMSEIAMPQFRGALLTWYAISMAIGQFTAAIANQIVNSTTTDYRRVFYSEFALLGVWLPCLLWLPESPVWYIHQGKFDKAKKALHRLVGNVKDYDLDHEFDVLHSEIVVSDAVASSYSDNDWKAFFQWGNFRRAIAAALPITAANLSGGAYIYNYSTYFFQVAGLNDAFLASTILNIIYLVSLIVSFIIIERVGRRALMFVGLFGLSASNFLIAGLAYLPAGNSSSGNALVAMCSIWEAFYSLTLAALSFVCLIEVSSYKLRAKTAAFGSLCNSLIGLIWSYCIPLIISSTGGAGWGQKVGFLFGATMLLYTIPTYFFYPETRGRLYTEIDELFERKVPIWRFHKTSTSIRPVAGGQTTDQTMDAA